VSATPDVAPAIDPPSPAAQVTLAERNKARQQALVIRAQQAAQQGTGQGAQQQQLVMVGAQSHIGGAQ
jgi:hypothetical protein